MITKQDWLKLPLKVRHVLIEALLIPRSGLSIVEGDRVIDDGRSDEDFLMIDITTLREYAEADIDDITELYRRAIAKASGEKLTKTTNKKVTEPELKEVISDKYV